MKRKIIAGYEGEKVGRRERKEGGGRKERDGEGKRERRRGGSKGVRKERQRTEGERSKS